MLNEKKSRYSPGKTILFVFLVCMLSVQISQAQWQPDFRLTNNSGVSSTCFNNARSIAAKGNFIHVVWHDSRDGNLEIYTKSSTNQGVSWGADTRLTNNANFSNYPSIAASFGINYVHVVWEDLRDGNYEIYYKSSPDGGGTWEADRRLTDNSGASHFPSIAFSPSLTGYNFAHVVWQDNRDANEEIYYKRSINSGNAWEQDVRLTSNSSISGFPSISVYGSVVHVVWHENRDGNYEIYYKRSPDDGISWGADTRLTNNSATSAAPSISAFGSDVHVAWQDERDGNKEIYTKRSTNAGVTWGADVRLSDNSFVSTAPSVFVSSPLVRVVWDDNRDGNSEIYTKGTQNGGLTWGSETRLTNNASFSETPSMIIAGPVVHVVWEDQRDGNEEIYYKRDPTGGNPIGIININSEIPNQFSLSQNYPNPFNPATKIQFALPKSSFAKLVIYDMLGREIVTLVNEQLNAGTYEADWNASNYSSGVYYYKISAHQGGSSTGDYTETMKMVLIK